MEPVFSQELIIRCKEYFCKRCNLEISDEEAEIYLGSLANLYGVWEEIVSESKK
jgi:hypothetical protein